MRYERGRKNREPHVPSMVNQRAVVERCKEFVHSQAGDVAHDLEHLRRVVHNAALLCAAEGAREEIVIPAAWLHDCVAVPKGSSHRLAASRLAAEAASVFLAQCGVASEQIVQIAHAIEAHSFSAQIEPRTLEARVVQDADRVDALGAIGLARCLMLGGELKRPLYSAVDPFCEERLPDDAALTLDHLYAKLFKLPGMMHTAAGRLMAAQRAEFLRHFVDQLKHEIGGVVAGGRNSHNIS